MNPPLESRVVKKILDYLRSRGGFWMKVHGSPVQLAGVPDIIGCYLGQFVGLEVKRSPHEKPTEIQVHIQRKIVAAGGVTATIYSVDQARAILDEIESLRRPKAPDQD